ncbi:MAG: hypothetical protein D6732_28920, partial [Methanobacteriota archaeon]
MELNNVRYEEKNARFANPKVPNETFQMKIVHFWSLFLLLKLALLFHVLGSPIGKLGQLTLLISYLLYIAIADSDNVFKLFSLRGLANLIVAILIYFLPLITLDSIFHDIYDADRFFTTSTILK